MLPTLLHMHLLLLLLYTRYLLSSADEGMRYLFRLPSELFDTPGIYQLSGAHYTLYS